MDGEGEGEMKLEPGRKLEALVPKAYGAFWKFQPERAERVGKEAKRFIKFAIVGASGTVVDFGLLNFGILVLGLTKALANTISFSAAVVNNFVWNRLWTFPETRSSPFLGQLWKFFLVSLAGYALNQTIFLGLDHFLLYRFGVLGYNLSKAVATLVVLFWNFGANRVWTYREV
jgi:putative flippase GtrA